MRTDAVYELFVVKYGTRTTTRSEVFLNYPLYGEPDAPIGMDYYFWLARNGEHTVLIDTGFSAHGGRARNRTMLVHPTDALAALGVDPAAVTSVALTHAHYDHAGNVGQFPAASFVLAADEYEFWTGPHAHHPLFHHSVEDDELRSLNTAAAAGRTRTFDDRTEIAPGITMIRVGGHTPGQSIVTVATTRGTVLLASDAIHYYEEYERAMPFSSLTGVLDTYVAFDRIRAMLVDGSADHLVSGHDPATFERLAGIAEPVLGIAALDGLAVRVGETKG